jgi:hypothetical protein
MSLRSWPRGSFSMREGMSQIIVGRVSRVYRGQFGMEALLGLPLRAKAIRVPLIWAANCLASGPPPVIGAAISTLSNMKGMSIVCDDSHFPPSTGDFHAKL